MAYLAILMSVFALLLASGTARADYLSLELAELFGGSELIVLGTIEGVGADSFTFREIEIYAGSTGDAPVHVAKYGDWTGGRRWDVYRPGQSVLLFLTKPAAGDKAADWRIRGRGGEGEMPIDGGGIFPHGLNLEGFDRQVFEVQGGELYGYRFNLEMFISALTGYIQCFGAHSPAAAQGAQEPPRACTEGELASYRATSALHRYLAPPHSGGTK